VYVNVNVNIYVRVIPGMLLLYPLHLHLGMCVSVSVFARLLLDALSVRVSGIRFYLLPSCNVCLKKGSSLHVVVVVLLLGPLACLTVSVSVRVNVIGTNLFQSVDLCLPTLHRLSVSVCVGVSVNRCLNLRPALIYMSVDVNVNVRFGGLARVSTRVSVISILLLPDDRLTSLVVDPGVLFGPHLRVVRSLGGVSLGAVLPLLLLLLLLCLS
jgi:hypothetical protein